MYDALTCISGHLERLAAVSYTHLFDPLEVFLLSLTISARHLFYSVSMLKKYDDLGWKRWALYYTLCDETFSVVSTVEPPEGVDAGKFYLFVSLLDWNYWVTASMLGGVLGLSLIHI